MSSKQEMLPLEPGEAAPPANGSDRPAEAAWIESDRGKPHQAKRGSQTKSQAPAIERLFGRVFPSTTPTDEEWRETVHPDDRQRVVDALAAGRATGTFDSTYRIRLPDGADRTVRDRVLLLGDRWQLRLIAEVPAAEATDPPAITPGADWLDAALDCAILRCDHAGAIVETFGPHALMPATPSVLIGQRVSDVVRLPLPMRQRWAVALDRCLDTHHPQIAAYVLDQGDGPRSFEARMMPVAGAAVIGIRDVGERDALRSRVERFAMTDVATGLGNARSLRERLEGWMRHGVEVAAMPPVALLVVDVDRFKQANDLYGRSIADSLLRLVAQRIHREALGEVLGRSYDANATNASLAIDPADDAASEANLAVARLGGDQFAIAWRIDDRSSGAGEDSGGPGERVLTLAHRLIVSLGTPTRIAGQNLFVRASIGVAIYPTDALEPSTLLSQAEGALKRAKQAGRNQYRRHGDDATATAPSASVLPNTEAGMRAALASGQFLLLYQPKFELASSLTVTEPEVDTGAGGVLAPGAIVAVEALVRWRTPTGALLVPHDFIPLAEASGMIRPLGDWVLRTALAEAARFAASGGARVGVAVNVSLLQLHDRAFLDTVSQALGEYGFLPGELTLEIAETALLDDIRLVADVVAELSALGVRLAIDHFGVGTAGLVALKALPVDEIKIDRSFVAGAAIDAFDATIVSGLIEMAHNLGKTVTADGVERVDQIAALAQMRCDAIQGYFIGEPMTATELVGVPSLWRKRLDRPA